MGRAARAERSYWPLELRRKARDANHLDACKMMMVARGGCQVAADVSSAALETWADLKANKYAEACDTGLDGEKGYRITNAGRAAYKVEIRRPSKR